MAAIFFIGYCLDDGEEENQTYLCPVFNPLVRHHLHEKAETPST